MKPAVIPVASVVFRSAQLIELDRICVQLDLVVSASQHALLLAYLALLERWNGVYNLTAVRDRDAMLSQHLADCLSAMPALRRALHGGRLLDVGSGGGLPGVVAAVLMPDVEVVCVDAVAKKAAFIQQVAGSLGLPNLKARHTRVEQLVAGRFEVITARAFATLTTLCELTQPHLAPGGVWLAMKGRTPEAEIAALPAAIEAFHVEQLQVPGMAAQRCLVWMRVCHPLQSP